MRRADERGAVLLFVAVVVALLVAVSAFAVDLGMQRVARRDMQAVADVVALDLSRLVDGRTRAQIESPGLGDSKRSLADALTASIARNAASTTGSAPDIKAYLVKSTTGEYATASGIPVQVASGEVPDAVVVVARTQVEFGLARVMGVSSGGAIRAAVAGARPPSVCFSVGTTTLALDTTRSVLSPLLDDILRVNLKAISYAGIVSLKSVYVPLADLLVALDVGTVDDLATTSVTLSDFVAATAKAIKANDPTADVAVLEALRLGVSGLAIPLGSILQVTTGGPSSGLSGDVNVLDILTAAIVAANGEEGVEVDTRLLPTGAHVELSVIQPPRIACGSPSDTTADGTPNPPRAESAQLRLHVTSPLLANSTYGLTRGGIDLKVRAGSGEATLTGLSCAPESVTFDVDTGAAAIENPVAPAYGQVSAVITFGKFLSFIPGLGWTLELALKLLGLNEVGLDILVAGQIASAHRTGISVAYPGAPAMPVGYTVTGDSSTLHLTGLGVKLATGQNGLVSALGSLLSATLDSLLSGLVVPLVNNVLDPLLTSILTPVLRMLGIQLGVTEINMLGRPKCSSVRLIG